MIVIPLRNQSGQLVGYAGRMTRDEQISGTCPKYLFPCDRERNGVMHEFRKSLLLYNGHSIAKPVSELIVVEGFPATWWLWQCGFFNTVAVMGSSCSQEQGKIIVRLLEQKPANVPLAIGGRVTILTDGDDAGARCAASIFECVGPSRFVRWVKLDRGKQPTDYSAHELMNLMGIQ